jgi:hypothetical protein
MDREMLEDHLALAEQHITEGEMRLTRQRELVSRLESRGLEAIEARRLLDNFEETQAMHVADRDRILRKLSE